MYNGVVASKESLVYNQIYQDNMVVARGTDDIEKNVTRVFVETV